jgi:hypothetical protein
VPVGADRSTHVTPRPAGRGTAERAGQLYALAECGYRQAGYQLWRTDAEEHRQFDTELRAALGDRYEEVLAQSQTIDPASGH